MRTVHPESLLLAAPKMEGHTIVVNDDVAEMGFLDTLSDTAISLVVTVVILGAGALFLAEFAADATVAADPNATYQVVQGQSALQTMGGKLGLMILILVIVLVITLIQSLRRTTSG